MTNVQPDPDGNIIGEPVTGFGRFSWRGGRWESIFDAQVDVIQRDLARAHAEDFAVVYLSCPISSRGGGSHRTNVDVANFTARRLMHEWGERVFVLNPAAYQMESREGTGLVLQHIRQLFGTPNPESVLEELQRDYPLGGGDYMRMWIRVLVEDAQYLGDTSRRDLSCGGMFDAFYFLGPSDIAAFLSEGREQNGTALIESYFARKYATDLDFRTEFASEEDKHTWSDRRKRFFRYYALRGSASFSLGSRDEWNALVRINEKRRDSPAYGPSEQLACFFDGRQADPAAVQRLVSGGYELTSDVAAPPNHPHEVAWPMDRPVS